MAVTANGFGINDIFNGQSDLTSALDAGRTWIESKINSMKTTTDIQILEDRLNKYFNPNNAEDGGRLKEFDPRYYLNNQAQQVGQIWLEMAESFDLETQTVSNKDSSYKMITVNRIKQAISQATSIVKQLEIESSNVPNSTSKEQLENLLNNITMLQLQATTILNLAEQREIYKPGTGNYAISTSNTNHGQNIMSIVSKLEGFVRFFSDSTNTDIIQDCARRWEQALQEAGKAFLNEGYAAANKETSKLLNELINKNTLTGEEKIIRGSNKINYKVKIGLGSKTAEGVNEKLIEDQLRTATKTKPKGISHFKQVNNKKSYTTEFTYSFNPSVKASGKMDARLVIQPPEIAPVNDIRVSAKNWPMTHSGDLGETTIDAAITRTGGASVAEAYKLIMKSNIGANLSFAHNVAKMLIKADIAMGLSQGINEDKGGAGYANILIINTGTKVRVLDLTSMVLDNQIKVERYNDNEISSEMQDRFKLIKSIRYNRTDAYLLLATSYLNSIKVTMRPKLS